MRHGRASPNKEKNCDEDDPADHFRGDCWDHVALDPEHRLVVAVVPGPRTTESVEGLVGEVKVRTGGTGHHFWVPLVILDQ